MGVAATVSDGQLAAPLAPSQAASRQRGPRKKDIFNAIRQEYYDSKEWAKEQNFVWKESIDGVFSVQLFWKMMKEIMNSVPDDFEQKREMAKNAWRRIVRENFGEVADA